MRLNLFIASGLVVGLSCSATALGQQLYFADIFLPTIEDGLIQRVNADGSGLTPVITVGGGLRSLDVDAAAGKVYWADVNNFAVRRANLDGSGQEDVISSGLQFPAAIRLELAESRIWVGDASAETVGYSPLTGGPPLTWTGAAFFSGLVIDAGEVFHTTSISATTGNLVRSPFAGSPTNIVTGTGKPQKVAVDRLNGKVYWTDSAQRSVRRADLDGSNIQTLYVDPSGFPTRGIAVDPAGGKVYWGQDFTDEGVLGGIMSMNLDGTDIAPVLLGVGFVQDLVFVGGGGPPVCYANCDASTTSPVLNVADFTCFLQRFAAGESYANCDNSTTAPTLNVADFTCFLQSFAAGCP